MVKKRKTSAKRRILPHPPSFRQFIRKNLLIIAGLLLLPVTVGAVVSSYNYANQGRAAKLQAQDNFSQGKSNQKQAILKTQDVIEDLDTHNCDVNINKGSLCGSNKEQCVYCYCSGDLTNSEVGDDLCSWEGCPDKFLFSCGYITPTPFPTSTSAMKQPTESWTSSDTGEKPISEDIQDNSSRRNRGGGHTVNDPSRSEGGVPGCLRCFAGECNDGRKYGSDTCAPQQTCDQRREDACKNNRGFKQNLGGLSADSFDFQKAIKNFFGGVGRIFGL